MKKRDLFAAYNLLKAKFLKKKIPLIVGWSLTNRCNLTCSYCMRWRSKIDELSTKEIFSVIDELSRMGTYSINFTGGEALIREDIGRIINYAKNKSIKIGVSTNGLLVPQKINELKKLDYLTLSFDGDEETHALQRNNRNYWQVLMAIKVAKENNIYVRLHTVLTKNNIESIDFILEFARGYSIVVDFSVIEFEPFSEEENVRLLLPSKEKFKLAIRRLIVGKKNGNRNIGNSLGGLLYLYQWPNYKRITCCAGKIYCRIESNGDVYPCTNLIYKIQPRNCIKLGFKDAFLSLGSVRCESCWCSTRIDMNYVYTLSLKAIRNLKTNYRLW